MKYPVSRLKLALSCLWTEFIFFWDFLVHVLQFWASSSGFMIFCKGFLGPEWSLFDSGQIFYREEKWGKTCSKVGRDGAQTGASCVEDCDLCIWGPYINHYSM